MIGKELREDHNDLTHFKQPVRAARNNANTCPNFFIISARKRICDMCLKNSIAKLRRIFWAKFLWPNTSMFER